MDQILGEIRLFGGSFAPYGWLLCNGQQISKDEFSALFQLISAAMAIPILPYPIYATVRPSVRVPTTPSVQQSVATRLR
jgi:hypothetical protein